MGLRLALPEASCGLTWPEVSSASRIGRLLSRMLLFFVIFFPLLSHSYEISFVQVSLSARVRLHCRVGALLDNCLCNFDLYYFSEVSLILFQGFKLVHSLIVHSPVACGACFVEWVSCNMHFFVCH